MLDYKLLEAFALTILEGGFEKASRKLHLTQSAVSQRVKQLEDQYGQILLKRTTPPEPTENGLPLLVHYRQVSQLETDLRFGAKNDVAAEFASLAIAVNADSLATWFFAAVKEVLEKEHLVLELHVDDQERTHELMQEGKVWGCVSTRSQPLQGCRATRLGRVRYGIFANGDFAEKWFPGGLSQDALERAPMARFNRKDDLNSRMFALLLPRPPDNPPTFFLPSTEIYCLFVVEGKCYGILPEQQSNGLETAGRIINLDPGHFLDVDLYWHSWNLKSALMERFSRLFIAGSREILSQEF